METEKLTRNEISEFEKTYEYELNHARVHILINALLDELQKFLKGKKLENRWIAIVKRLKEAEEKSMPLIVNTCKTKSLEEALYEFEEIGEFFQSPDLRGLHRRKNIPRGKELVDQYTILRKIKSLTKYRNDAAMKLDINDLLQKLGVSNSKRHLLLPKAVSYFKKYKKSEFAYHVLADIYGARPGSIKNLISKSRRLSLLKTIF